MLILANSYAPLAPVTPAMKILFLVVIILFEAIYLKGCWKSEKTMRILFHVSIANILSALVGVLIGVGSLLLEAWWMSLDYVLFPIIQPILFPNMQLPLPTFLDGFMLFIGIFMAMISFPWIVWLFCYHVSWHLEFKYLSRYIKSAQYDMNSVRNANRWTYGFLGFILFLVTCVSIVSR